MSRDVDLQVSLFGPFSLRLGGCYVPLKLSGNTRDLLSYLMMREGEAVRRELLVAQLWPQSDPEKGRSALNTALWRVNKAIADLDGVAVQTMDDLVLLTVDPHVLIDARGLERQFLQARRQSNDLGQLQRDEYRALADLVALCHGSFLEGCSADWVHSARAQMEAVLIRALDLLMRDSAKRGALDDAIGWARQILSCDPLRETTYLALMQLYAYNGERRRALLVYEDLRRILQAELQIEPDQTTQRVAADIIANRLMRNAAQRSVFETRTRQTDMRVDLFHDA